MSKQVQTAVFHIQSLRKQIDEVDIELVRLLNRRASLADQIGKIKRRLQIPVYAPGREEQVIFNVQSKNPGPLSEGAIARIYERIIDESRRLEQDNFNKGPIEEDVK